MTEHELLQEYERYYPRSKKVWAEIDRRLKLLDYFIKPFSPELVAEMERQFKEENEQ